VELLGSIVRRSSACHQQCHQKLTRSLMTVGIAAVLAVSSLTTRSTAWGQAPRPTAPTADLANIRKTNLDGPDRTSVENWVGQQIQQLFAATNDKAAQSQGQKFFEEVQTHTKAADATPPFREGLATILATAFNKQYPSSSATRRPLATVYVLMSINQAQMSIPQTTAPAVPVMDAFKLALTDTTSGGRYLGASGLLNLLKKLNDDQWRVLLPDVQKAATAEKSPIVLGQLYDFLLKAEGSRIEAAIPILANILDARLVQFDQNKGWPTLADANAAKWLSEKLANSANTQLQMRAVSILARLMTNAMYAYVTKPGDAWSESLEKTIRACEASLKSLVSARAANAQLPNPDVTTAMLENSHQQVEAMMTALQKWIGTSNKPGVLNAAPFNLEPGLKIAPPTLSPTTEPTTATAVSE